MNDLEIRDSSNGAELLEGYASRFGVDYTVRDTRGSYAESVQRGAFAQGLRDDPDVLLLISHAGSPLARTRPSRTLRLSEDGEGLAFSASLAKDDPEVQGAVSKVRRGLLSQASFSFRVSGDDGQEWHDDFTRRTIKRGTPDHGDVSLTTWGANPETGAHVRAKPVGMAERRALVRAVGDKVVGAASGAVLLRDSGTTTDCNRGCNGAGLIELPCPNCSTPEEPDDGVRPPPPSPEEGADAMSFSSFPQQPAGKAAGLALSPAVRTAGLG